MKVILCIDDSANRFQSFYREAAARGVQLIVTDDPEFIESVLYQPVVGAEIVGVCLDHDMPGRDAKRIANDLLGPRNVPVAIVSNNDDGSRALAGILDDFAVPNRRIPAGMGGRDWFARVLGFFGVLMEEA